MPIKKRRAQGRTALGLTAQQAFNSKQGLGHIGQSSIKGSALWAL